MTKPFVHNLPEVLPEDSIGPLSFGKFTITELKKKLIGLNN